MAFGKDSEWVPPCKKKFQTSSFGGTAKPREQNNIRLAKIQTLEKIQELRRAENTSVNMEDDAHFSGRSEELNEDLPQGNYSDEASELAHDNELSLKGSLTLLKCHVRHNTKVNPVRVKHSVKKGKAITKHYFLSMLQLKKKEEPYEKRKRIKPRLSVTIPEDKLFPKKKPFILRSKQNETKPTTFNQINSHLLETNKNEGVNDVKSLEKVKVRKTKSRHSNVDPDDKSQPSNSESISSSKDNRSDTEVIERPSSDSHNFEEHQKPFILRSKQNETKPTTFNQINSHLLETNKNEGVNDVKSLEKVKVRKTKSGHSNINPDDKSQSSNSESISSSKENRSGTEVIERPSSDSHNFEEHFEAIQRILENMAVNISNKVDCAENQFPGSDEDKNSPKDIPAPSYSIDRRHEGSGKLVLKLRRESDSTQTSSDENENVNGRAEPPIFNEKDATVDTLGLQTSQDACELGARCTDSSADFQESKKSQYIHYLYGSVLKHITSKMHDMIEANENYMDQRKPLSSLVTEISKENNSTSSGDDISLSNISGQNIKSVLLENKVPKHRNQDYQYEQLYENFTDFYSKVFDNETNALCTELEDLLYYIVCNENDLLVNPVEFRVDRDILHYVYKKNGQDKIKCLNQLFLHIYKKICTVTANRKQHKLLLTAWFVKLKSRISSMAKRPWTYKETRINLITYLLQETLDIPVVGDLFFRHEEGFLQDCMMVIDYSLKCKINLQEERQAPFTMEGNIERTVSPTFNVCIDSHSDSTINSVFQNPNAKKTVNYFRHALPNLQKCLDMFNKRFILNNQTLNDNLSNYNDSQTLYNTFKISSAEKFEKLVERIRIGDIDLDEASRKMIQVLNNPGTSDTATSGTGTSDTATSDTGTFDTSTSDTATSDTGTSDTGTSDA